MRGVRVLPALGVAQSQPGPTGSGGVSFVGYRFSSNGGSTWGSCSIYNGIEINAVIPTPATMGLLAAAGAFAARRRR